MTHLPQNTVDKIAADCFLKMIPVRESFALFTVDLVAGRDGRIVLQLVEGVHKLEIVNVTTHHLNSLDLTVAILS